MLPDPSGIARVHRGKLGLYRISLEDLRLARRRLSELRNRTQGLVPSRLQLLFASTELGNLASDLAKRRAKLGNAVKLAGFPGGLQLVFEEIALPLGSFEGGGDSGELQGRPILHGTICPLALGSNNPLGFRPLVPYSLFVLSLALLRAPSIILHLLPHGSDGSFWVSGV
jgi:hypothetical protein